MDGKLSKSEQMVEKSPEILVSVVIPTKNRHAQLFETLKANAQVGALREIEFVIADNSTQSMPQEMVAYCRATFANFTYANDVASKSIIGNFNYGLGLANGKFIIFIGDDDFVLPELLPAARVAEQEGLECLIYEPDKYYWNSCTFSGASAIGPMCLIKNQPTRTRGIETDEELRKSANNGFLTIESLPRAYHGLVSREKLTQHFGGATQPIVGGSPDISMAVSLAIKRVKTRFWGRPLSIYGASSGSGGGMTTSKTHLLPLDKATFLEPQFVRDWPGSVPSYWSEYTVFPASAIYVHQLYGIKVPDINLAATYASIIINESKMTVDVWRTFRQLEAKLQRRVLRRFPAAFARKLAGWTVRRMRDSHLLSGPKSMDITHGVSHLDVIAAYSS